MEPHELHLYLSVHKNKKAVPQIFCEEQKVWGTIILWKSRSGDRGNIG